MWDDRRYIRFFQCTRTIPVDAAEFVGWPEEEYSEISHNETIRMAKTISCIKFQSPTKGTPD